MLLELECFYGFYIGFLEFLKRCSKTVSRVSQVFQGCSRVVEDCSTTVSSVLRVFQEFCSNRVSRVFKERFKGSSRIKKVKFYFLQHKVQHFFSAGECCKIVSRMF